MTRHRYYLGLARHASIMSHDPSTKCGAVIVSRDVNIVSVAYNDFPQGTDPEYWFDRTEKLAHVIHAEMGAILSAKQSVQDCTIYVWPMTCCDRCAMHIIQAGIIRVVTPPPSKEQIERWGARATKALRNAGVELITLND